MRLHILGSNGTYPSPGRPASGYLVDHGGTLVWCDAGPGTFTALWDRIGLEDLSAVVISHSHPDHCADLFALYHALAYGSVGRPKMPVWAPGTVFERIGAFLAPDDPGRLESVFELHAVEDGDQARIGDIAVTFAGTDHSVPTVASRWEADGRTLAYSADTGPRGSWASVADSADLFVCEASYQGEPGVQPYPHHLTATQAGQIARSRGASRLVITHIPPHLDAAVSVDEAERSFDRPVALAVPGATHDV